LRGQQVARIALGLALAVLASLGAPCAAAQNSRDSNPGPASAEVDSAAGGAGNGRILLVLPFDNRSGQPSLEWVREAAPELLGSRFRSAGFAPMSRADRLYALDHLGLPQGFQPSRASSLKLAQTLDADSIVVGSFSTDGAEIVAEARLVDVPHLRMGEPVTARGPLRDLIAVYDALAWKLTRQLDPAFKGSEETFIAAGAGLSVIAFEQYIRGITESDQAERLHHLSQAVLLSPGFSSAWMALGREQYSGQLYDQAAAAFAKVERSDPDALEAGFYRGLSLLFSGDYPHAEQAFGNVARELPLAEVLNNQGVAVSRQSHDGTVLFRQAIAADPSAADFHFNLAVSLRRNAAPAEALAELGASLKLRPIDSEALDLQDAWSPTAVHSVAALDAAATISATASKSDPLERMSRNFDAVAFRQAAQMLDRMNAARLAQLAPAEQALKLETQARDYLERGLLLEAERLYQSANAVDPNSAAAHAGLAQVRERAGDAEAARKEAHASLDLAPSSDACLVLARLDLAANRLDEARGELAESLKLEPNNPAAVELNAKIEAAAAEKHSGTGER
jgi:tetratricopeptide (TPR) repeat protein